MSPWKVSMPFCARVMGTVARIYPKPLSTGFLFRVRRLLSM